jgi:hypothetical protein
MSTPESLPIRVVRGNPTPQELAAVTAVLTAVLAEEAAAEELAAHETASLWERTQRPQRDGLDGRTGWHAPLR